MNTLNHTILLHKYFQRINLPLVLGIYITVVFLITFQTVLLENMFTNNFGIFRNAYYHLIHNENIYFRYQGEKEFFKYSPSFALLFGAIAYFPPWFGLFLLNLSNTLCIYFAIRLLPLDTKQKIFILLFSLQEVIRTMQGSQTNGWYLGLLLVSFVFFEKKNYLLAITCIVAIIYLKLFAIFFLFLFFLYPSKLKSILYGIGVGLIFLAMPLLVVSIDQLVFLYQQWYYLLLKDVSQYSLYSAKGVIDAWLHTNVSGILVLIIGLIIAGITVFVASYKSMQEKVCLILFLLLSSLLFRQSAENAGYVIAVVCASIYFSYHLQNSSMMILAVIYYFITVFMASDLYPKMLRTELYEMYKWRAVPSIILWFSMLIILIKQNRFRKMV